jgi:hypothetical protein
MDELEYVRAHSDAGRLFGRVLELEFACDHFAVPWSDVTAEEVKGLQVLKDERNRYERDLRKDPDRVTVEEARQIRLMQKYGGH